MVETITKTRMLKLYESEQLWEVINIGDYVYARTWHQNGGMRTVRCKI